MKVVAKVLHLFQEVFHRFSSLYAVVLKMYFKHHYIFSPRLKVVFKQEI